MDEYDAYKYVSGFVSGRTSNIIHCTFGDTPLYKALEEENMRRVTEKLEVLIETADLGEMESIAVSTGFLDAMKSALDEDRRRISDLDSEISTLRDRLDVYAERERALTEKLDKFEECMEKMKDGGEDGG